MPLSMTGFSTADVAVAPFQLNWELRSVNHRFLDLGFRLPEEFRRFEPEYRALIAGRVKRGKVDCTLKVTTLATDSEAVAIHAESLASVARLQEAMQAEFPDAKSLSVGELLRWPGVLKEPEQDPAALAEPAKRCLTAALETFQDARRREGDRIAEMLEQRNEAIVSLVASVRPLLAGAQARYREKLQERLQRLDVQANPERLEQELALIAQRMDIAEEVDRLESHIVEVRDVLGRDEPVGRRLDFLIQELNREANTLASKAQDEQMTRGAVDIKVLIEQMREQVQNLE